MEYCKLLNSVSVIQWVDIGWVVNTQAEIFALQWTSWIVFQPLLPIILKLTELMERQSS